MNVEKTHDEEYINKAMELDLFANYKELPQSVQDALSMHDENGDQYEELNKTLERIEPLGYVFEYYLDAEPYALRKIIY